MFDQYSKWLVGFYARLYEGRCYQALGDYQRAEGCFEEIISQSSVTPAFRKLIASAYGYQTECHVAQKKYDEAIAGAKAWLGDAHGPEAQEPEWLALRFQMAVALQQKSDAASTTGAERRKLLAEAREAYRLVSTSPGEFQREARSAGAALTKGDEPRKDQPRDFKAAYEAGKEAMASVNAATMALPSAEKNNPSALPELKTQAEDGKEEARQNFRLALGLVDDKTDRDQVNEVRYFLCWLCWDHGDYYDSAALGEFLARRYSDHPSAEAAAKLALASYDKLYRSASPSDSKQPPDTEFEARHMAKIAEFITRRWPGSPTAEAAMRILVSYAIRNDRIDEAKAMIGQVSAAARPALESQLGNAMWGRYLELSQADGASRPDDAKLKTLRSQALELLQSGFDDARKSGTITESSVTSGLYLAQSLLGRRQVYRSNRTFGRAEERAAVARRGRQRGDATAGVCGGSLQGRVAGLSIDDAAPGEESGKDARAFGSGGNEARRRQAGPDRANSLGAAQARAAAGAATAGRAQECGSSQNL